MFFLNKSTVCFGAVLTALSFPDVVIASQPAKKLPATSSFVTLGDVDGETFDQMTVVNIRFQGKPTWEKVPQVEDHGMFLQITLPDTLVTEPGKFFDGAPPHFPKIALIQANGKDGAIRIFTTKPANLIRESSKTELLGDRLIMTLDHKSLETKLGAAPTSSEPSFVGPPVPNAKNVVSADEVISSTVVRSDLAAPSLVLKKEASNSLTGNGAQIDLSGRLTKVAVFSAIMFMILALTWLVKPYLKKKRKKKTAEGGELQALSFETLATMPLSPRQKLMVVQIGNDRVLLGVSSDSINFLTNLNQGQAAVPSFAGAGSAAAATSAAKVLTSMASRRFSEAMADESSVEMVPRPVLKNIEGNDAVSLSAPFAEDPEEHVLKPVVKSSTRSAAPRVTAKIKTKEGTNDEKPRSTLPAKTERPGSRLNIRIDDNGATKVSNKTAPKAPEHKKQAIDDITSIIREKLNTLRTI